MRKGIMGILSLCLVMCMLSAGCGAANAKDASSDQAAVQSAETGPEGTGEAEAESTVSEPEAEEKTEEDAPQAEEDGEAETERKESEMMLQMTIGETLVDVAVSGGTFNDPDVHVWRIRAGRLRRAEPAQRR